jgi:ABC-2 type transport system ATP-binding protein
MIELTHVQKVVAQTTLVDIDSLSVAAGEIAAVTGLTGRHKTTFVALLSGQTRPTAGQIRLGEIDPVQDRHEFARQVGILTAENGLYPRLSARQNLTFYCDLYGLSSKRADEIMSLVGLQDHTSVQAEHLAPGLARRLAFGRAILHRPAILLLVDPFAECDQASVDLLTRAIKQVAEANTAVLIITSEGMRLSHLCHTIHVLEQGRHVHSYHPGESETDEALPFKIPARLEGKVAFVNPADILYATAEDGRTFLCTGDGRIPTHLTLTEVEERLARSGFFRAHRSYLVNLQHIKEVIAYTRNSFTLILDSGVGRDNDSTEIPLSKGAARELRDLLDY